MIQPNARRDICRREVVAIRKRLRAEYKPRIKAAATKEEKRAIRGEMNAKFAEKIEPYRDEIIVEGRCRKCGYVLYGLADTRCPECGTEFEPELLDTLSAPTTHEGPSPYTLF